MRVSEVTSILNDLEKTDAGAAEKLLPLVYDELRKLAAQRLAREKPGQTLQATALVHEAYLRLVGTNGPQTWKSRGHFFAAAAEAMRRILVERARRRLSVRHGGWWSRVELDASADAAEPKAREIVQVHEALKLLARESPVKAELVKLRYFGGLSHQEAAELLDISRATADRYWVYAKAFLFAALRDGQS
jgi:RNA polymerase sigma factor (TIGR02999 family)